MHGECFTKLRFIDHGGLKSIDSQFIAYHFERKRDNSCSIYKAYLIMKLFRYLNRIVNSLISIVESDSIVAIRLVYEEKDYDKIIKSINNFTIVFPDDFDDGSRYRKMRMELMKFCANKFINEIYFERPYIIKAQSYLWKIERLDEFEYSINDKFKISLSVEPGSKINTYTVRVLLYVLGRDSPMDIPDYVISDISPIEIMNVKEIRDTIKHKFKKNKNSNIWICGCDLEMSVSYQYCNENEVQQIISTYHDVMKNTRIFDEEYKLEAFGVNEEEII